MPVDITNLRSTIVPKSDQLNAEQLLSGEMTITVSEVSAGNEEQPIIIHYAGENGRPFKPSKTVRKILLFAWGEDGRAWAGRSMTLYNDENVRFGGMAVGGIRLRAISHIDKEIVISLTAAKGKKAMHTIKVLKVVTLDQVLQAIKSASNKATMDAAKALAQQLTNPDDSDQALQAYRAKVEQLRAKAAPQPEPTPAIQDSSADFTPAPDDEPPY